MLLLNKEACESQKKVRSMNPVVKIVGNLLNKINYPKRERKKEREKKLFVVFSNQTIMIVDCFTRF